MHKNVDIFTENESLFDGGNQKLREIISDGDRGSRKGILFLKVCSDENPVCG